MNHKLHHPQLRRTTSSCGSSPPQPALVIRRGRYVQGYVSICLVHRKWDTHVFLHNPCQQAIHSIPTPLTERHPSKKKLRSRLLATKIQLSSKHGSFQEENYAAGALEIPAKQSKE